MTDTLRDNRIFPEEMHQKMPKPQASPHSQSWLWWLLALTVLLVVVYLFSGMGTSPKDQINANEDYEQQRIIVNNLQKTPALTSQERSQKIQVFFGESN